LAADSVYASRDSLLFSLSPSALLIVPSIPRLHLALLGAIGDHLTAGTEQQWISPWRRELGSRRGLAACSPAHSRRLFSRGIVEFERGYLGRHSFMRVHTISHSHSKVPCDAKTFPSRVVVDCHLTSFTISAHVVVCGHLLWHVRLARGTRSQGPRPGPILYHGQATFHEAYEIPDWKRKDLQVINS
jgi:hypothetical protein